MTIEQMHGVENAIDYQFKEISLLQQAFVRSSYTAENGGWDNEVLEFIGDKVLDAVVVKMLSDEYCYMTMSYKYTQKRMMMPVKKVIEPNVMHCDVSEGKLTDIKKALVQRKNLARRIDEFGFVKYLAMGKGDIENKVYEQPSVKEDLFEAILGAVAIDCEWNWSILYRVTERMLEPDLEESDNNPIRDLQEYHLSRYHMLPLYHVEEYNTSHWYKSGFDWDRSYTYVVGEPKYKAILKIKDFGQRLLGFGQSEKEARVEVAKYALKLLKRYNALPTIRDEIENPNVQDAISQLEILARRGYFDLPEYEYEETYDNDGNPIWNCKIKIDGKEDEFEANSSSKKEAKKQAAFLMLEYVLQED